MSTRVCPVWIGYLLASPLRRLFHNPDTILGPLLQPGMTVLDVGSAMGFFSIPAAKMVGPNGKVICVDCQPKMLATLEKRARRAGVRSQIESHACTTTSLEVDALRETVDVALAIAMVHESPDPTTLLKEIASTLKPKGTVLIAEPKGHVTPSQIDQTVTIAQSLGLTVIDRPVVKKTASFVMQRA